ncbi:hypothetical protein FACS189472_13020 [Alphaproteobacteria bacterium]|nr:hypothetical protein FACS189472_13020 [Alphaproteobacteria bacterium]
MEKKMEKKSDLEESIEQLKVRVDEIVHGDIHMGEELRRRDKDICGTLSLLQEQIDGQKRLWNDRFSLLEEKIRFQEKQLPSFGEGEESLDEHIFAMVQRIITEEVREIQTHVIQLLPDLRNGENDLDDHIHNQIVSVLKYFGIGPSSSAGSGSSSGSSSSSGSIISLLPISQTKETVIEKVKYSNFNFWNSGTTNGFHRFNLLRDLVHAYDDAISRDDIQDMSCFDFIAEDFKNFPKRTETEGK